MSAYPMKGGHEYHPVDAPLKRNGWVHNTQYSKFIPVIPKRYMRLVFATLVSIGIWTSFQRLSSAQEALTAENNTPEYPQVQLTASNPISPLPPLYEAYREYEDSVSEKNLRSHNGTQRYIYFANQAYGCGWGNVLQEIVLNTLLAAEANLGYAWGDYTWGKKSDYSDYNGKKIPSRIPLSTMIAGHILGLGPSNNEGSLPPSISSRAFDKICPKDERTVIHKDLVQAYLREQNPPTILDSDNGDRVLQGWASYLTQPELKKARCIEVKEDSFVAFDIWLFGSSRLHSLWGKLSQSLVLKHWKFSPLIRGMFEKNLALFSSTSSKRGFWQWIWTVLGIEQSQGCQSDDASCALDLSLLNDSLPLPVLVLHLRRGDFHEHCVNLAEWGSTFTAFNSFPQFQVRDRFDPPSIGDVSDLEVEQMGGTPTVVESMDERKRVYAQHCFPDVQQIVQRVRDTVHDYVRVTAAREEAEHSSSWWSGNPQLVLPQQRLNRIYIMTNGGPVWLAGVKAALFADLPQAGRKGNWEFDWNWEGVYTSRDLRLGWEEKPVAQALDSYIAHRAELFIGNGFSSLTSNIVMLRMKNPAIDPVQTRFW